jgi:hypothetical protein
MGVRPIAVENLKQAGKVLRCIFIKTNGVQCGSPALKNCAYCFAHGRMAMRHPSRLDMPILEDANSVQVAIMEVIRGLLDGDIDRKTGGLVLYGLQMASANLKYVSFEPKDRGAVIRDIADVVRYCDVDDVVESGADADQAASDSTPASESRCEEACAASSDAEPASQEEAQLTVDDLPPQNAVAGDLEAAADTAASADHSSTMREKLDKLRAEARAMSKKPSQSSTPPPEDAGIDATREMLDAMAEMHRLANVVADCERRIGAAHG